MSEAKVHMCADYACGPDDCEGEDCGTAACGHWQAREFAHDVHEVTCERCGGFDDEDDLLDDFDDDEDDLLDDFDDDEEDEDDLPLDDEGGEG